MSDISIPGVNSRFNTESLVQELVDAETIRLDRMKGEVEDYQTEKRIWQELNQALGNLRTSNRSLFNFENPFNERNAISSDDSVLRAEANREAIEGTTQVKVLRTAQADRFISRDLEEAHRIGQGVYRFTLGKESITLRFRGGTVQEFSTALNRRNPELLHSSVIQNRPGTQVILIESLKEGASYALGFEEDAVELAQELGWVQEAGGVKLALSETGGEVDDLSPEEGELLLAPGEERTFLLPEAVTETTGLVLRYEQRLVTSEGDSDPPPPGPEAPNSGSVSLRDVTLPNLPSAVILPELESEAPEIVEDYTVMFARNGDQTVPLPDVQDSVEFRAVQVPLSDYVSGLNALEIRNPNSLKQLTIRNIEIVNPDARDNMVPQNAVANARNALLEVEGIVVERESNSIDDVIPGVTLELRGASDKEIEVRVEPDIELVKESLIEWVARYNQIIRDTNILTRTSQDIIDEIEYFTDDQREEYTERLGMFQGDSVLNTLKQRLQGFTSNSYETRAGRDLSLLTQIGISTNASRGTTGVNLSRLRGYLEINEDVLDQSLANNFLAIKDLFGRDSDGDLIVDQGIGYQIDQLVQSFTGIGGIVSNRTSRYDTLISSSNEDIQDYESYLEEYEADVRRQFATMESAINNLENSSQGLQNLNSVNNRNNN